MLISGARRRRRSPEEAREEAVASARRLLLTAGPGGVTLKAVADDIGMSHGNLIHHFGSAAGLQSALMGAMVRDLAEALHSAIARVRDEQGPPRELIDVVFDAFDAGGAGRLAAWMRLSGDVRRLEPVRAAVSELVQALGEKAREAGRDPSRIPSALLFVTLCAFGDSVVGENLAEMLGRDRGDMRDLAAQLLPGFLGRPLEEVRQ